MSFRSLSLMIGGALVACTPQIAQTQSCDAGQVLVAAAGGGWVCGTIASSGDAGTVDLSELHGELSALDASVQMSASELMSASPADVPGALVLRDGAGSFSAHTLALDGSLVLNDGGIYAGTFAQPIVETALGNRSVYLGVGASVDGGLNGNPIGDTLAVGYLALTADSSGSRNTGVGTYALRMDTVGSGNTALGYQAGKGNVSGEANTAIGQDAFSQGSGDNNVAVGEAAMQQQNGSGNTAVGAAAMVGALVSNGTSNAAFGANSLRYGESFNTAIGAGALYATTGSYNTALGFNAGYALGASSTQDIDIGNQGQDNDIDTLRIGTQGDGGPGSGIDQTFIAGIYGQVLGNSALPVSIDENGRLGTAVAGGAAIEASDAALRSEVEALRAEVAALSSRLNALEKVRAR